MHIWARFKSPDLFMCFVWWVAQEFPDLLQNKHIHATYLIILQGHEIVVDVFVSCILLYPGFKLFMIKYLSTIFQDKGVPGQKKEKKSVSFL